MAKANPLQFIQQVRAEVSKVVWPTRREVMLTSAVVLVMADVSITSRRVGHTTFETSARTC